MNSLSNLDIYVLKTLEQWEIPGLALRVLKNSEVVHSRGYGVRELGKTDAVKEDTVFSIASCTKAFTATALGMLVDEGKLHWDDLVVKHLPTFQLADPYLTGIVTIRDLLAHRVGLKENFTIETQGLDYSLTDMVRSARYSKTTKDFRAKATYSNVMYTVAGEMIQAVSGLSWDDFLKERIFKPLGMTSSGTSAFALLKTENHSASHIRDSGGKVIVDPIDPAGYWTMDNTGPCGAVTSTLEDLTPWLLTHMNQGKHGEQQLFSQEIASEMHQPHMLVELPADSCFMLEAYGLGWYVTIYKNHRFIWHSGLFRGMFSVVGFVPDLDLGLIMLGNARDGAALMEERLTQWIIDRFLDLPEYDWVGKAYPQKLEQRGKYQRELEQLAALKRNTTKTSLALESYQGMYAFSPPDQWAVVMRDGDLRLERLRARKPYFAVLEHWHDDIFKPHWNDPLPDYVPATFVSFQIGVEGKPLGFTMQGPFIKSEHETRDYARVADFSEDYRVTF